MEPNATRNPNRAESGVYVGLVLGRAYMGGSSIGLCNDTILTTMTISVVASQPYRITGSPTTRLFGS